MILTAQVYYLESPYFIFFHHEKTVPLCIDNEKYTTCF